MSESLPETCKLNQKKTSKLSPSALNSRDDFKKKCEFAEPILQFKGSVRHVQKGHPTLVTLVDLFLQNW